MDKIICEKCGGEMVKCSETYHERYGDLINLDLKLAEFHECEQCGENTLTGSVKDDVEETRGFRSIFKKHYEDVPDKPDWPGPEGFMRENRFRRGDI